MCCQGKVNLYTVLSFWLLTVIWGLNCGFPWVVGCKYQRACQYCIECQHLSQHWEQSYQQRKRFNPWRIQDVLFIHLYKCKGNNYPCDNHWGISLLSITGKIFTEILLVHLTWQPNQGLLPDSQCGFCKEWGTINIVFAARQLQEKCQEQHDNLFSTYRMPDDVCHHLAFCLRPPGLEQFSTSFDMWFQVQCHHLRKHQSA